MLSICILIGLTFAPLGKHIGEILGGEDEINIISNGTLIAGNLTGFEYETVGSESSYYLALSITILGTLLLDFSAGNIF